MPVDFRCAQCGAHLRARDGSEGRHGTCGSCGGRFVIPGACIGIAAAAPLDAASVWRWVGEVASVATVASALAVLVFPFRGVRVLAAPLAAGAVATVCGIGWCCARRRLFPGILWIAIGGAALALGAITLAGLSAFGEVTGSWHDGTH